MPVSQFEKMDAERPGEPGGEGEYKVQTGFGWSNGVVLQFLQEYGWRPELLQECKPWVQEVGRLPYSFGVNVQEWHAARAQTCRLLFARIPAHEEKLKLLQYAHRIDKVGDRAHKAVKTSLEAGCPD